MALIIISLAIALFIHFAWVIISLIHGEYKTQKEFWHNLFIPFKWLVMGLIERIERLPPK